MIDSATQLKLSEAEKEIEEQKVWFYTITDKRVHMYMCMWVYFMFVLYNTVAVAGSMCVLFFILNVSFGAVVSKLLLFSDQTPKGKGWNQKRWKTPEERER